MSHPSSASSVVSAPSSAPDGPTRAQVTRRVLGAVVAAVLVAQALAWFLSPLFGSSEDFSGEEFAVLLLPIPFAPILFGLFGRLFEVPSVLITTVLGTILYFPALYANMYLLVTVDLFRPLEFLVTNEAGPIGLILLSCMFAFTPVALLIHAVSTKDRPRVR